MKFINRPIMHHKDKLTYSEAYNRSMSAADGGSGMNILTHASNQQDRLYRHEAMKINDATNVKRRVLTKRMQRGNDPLLTSK